MWSAPFSGYTCTLVVTGDGDVVVPDVFGSRIVVYDCDGRQLRSVVAHNANKHLALAVPCLRRTGASAEAYINAHLALGLSLSRIEVDGTGDSVKVACSQPFLDCVQQQISIVN